MKTNTKFNERRLLFIAYFWRYGIIGLTFILPTILGIIFYNVESLNAYTPYVVFISAGIPLCAMGIDYILGCIFKWDHMILVEQSCYHQKMNTYNLTWNVNIKEFILVGCVFLFFGICLILLPILHFVGFIK